MNARYLILFAISFVALCRPDADPKDVAGLPDGPGKAALVKMCLDCHDSGNFRKARMTADEWSESVADMVSRGAQGTPAEIDASVVYLTKYFGKGAPVRINTAPFAELRGVLGLSVAEVRALLEYREQNGDFKSVEDIQKVPGIDAAKVAQLKSKLLF
ncbi:MAG: helix-hairpin-helix domain-containing protein [Candidatus Solibacter sp.]